ncbi:DUF2515 family protein [Aquibacillus albus]|uniref:DUF2515 domain-containing protein n=1 Tax=Aquibacillus albus TaxID=1168171 RepID=A0ABS2MVH4_9BACI|nr:DUF2515 family protein [Aquibacillus albus]MBM7569863.1 hypothetical protein [Aquibacillus albus]
MKWSGDLENDFVYYIENKTKRYNRDNISRTKAYQAYYQLFPEVKWAFLASMVSRNAGWNMTDLETRLFQKYLSNKLRTQLFSTYERANWLIFSDAYPQLLLYQLSKCIQRPMFHLLDYFHVSTFMKDEWIRYWKNKNENRLLIALIINEQNVIESPVTDHPFFKKHVFLNWPYLIQDFFHLSMVIFPMRSGEVFASEVHDFSNVSKRIELGKKLSSILFHSDFYDGFFDFALQTEHTGSRFDYEQYMYANVKKSSPMLRSIYPVIDHQDKVRKDWFKNGGIKQKWWKPQEVSTKDNAWDKFYKKRKWLDRIDQWLS